MAAYREHRPDPPLAGLVETFWTRGDSPAEPQRIVPDGCLDVLFITAPDTPDRLAVVGAMTRHQMATLAPGGSIVAVRFLPGAGGPALAHPASLLTDRTVDLEDLWGTPGRHLRRRLGSVGTTTERLKLLQGAFGERLAGVSRPRVLDWLSSRPHPVSVDSLVNAAGCGPRHLRRLMPTWSGLSPRAFCRVLRFRQAWTAVRRGQRLADVALAAGYCDQAHLTNEFRALAGCPPSQFRPR